jgi:hypothetical protein
LAAQILPFPKPPPALSSPIATYLWVGEAHRKLSDLHAAGHLPARRLVVAASRLRHQRELIAAVGDAGGEIGLDTEVAELATAGRHAGRVRGTPWALPEGAGPLGPDHFQADAKTDRTAREIKALRPDPAEATRHNIDAEALMKRLADHSRTTEKIRTTLETIHDTRGNDVPRARIAALRSGGAPKSAKGQP